MTTSTGIRRIMGSGSYIGPDEVFRVVAAFLELSKAQENTAIKWIVFPWYIKIFANAMGNVRLQTWNKEQLAGQKRRIKSPEGCWWIILTTSVTLLYKPCSTT